MAKLLDISFIDDDLQKNLTKAAMEFGDKWTRKNNSWVKSGMKAAAQAVLPYAQANLARHDRTGATSRNLVLSSYRTGYRIGTPKRTTLASYYPKALRAKGYYPASQEFGWSVRGKKGGSVKGHHALGDALETNLVTAYNVIRYTIETRIKRDLKRARKI